MFSLVDVITMVASLSRNKEKILPKKRGLVRARYRRRREQILHKLSDSRRFMTKADHERDNAARRRNREKNREREKATSRKYYWKNLETDRLAYILASTFLHHCIIILLPIFENCDKGCTCKQRLCAILTLLSHVSYACGLSVQVES